MMSLRKNCLQQPASDAKGLSYDQEVLHSVSKKKPPLSSFKLLKNNGTSNFASTPQINNSFCFFKAR
ncbi:hypothetical protein HN51_021329 [Arachis hypogaea]